MLSVGTWYYCETSDDVNLIMSVMEKNGFAWASGARLRSQYQNAPIVYKIDEPRVIRCDRLPNDDTRRRSTYVSDVRNKLIAVLRRT